MYLDWASRDKIFVWGHRGAAAVEPENTVASFLFAAGHGVDGVECDVQLSRDGKVVVLHDATLDRTTEGHGPAGDLSWAKLSTLRTRRSDGSLSEEKIPLLEEVLEALPDDLPLLVEYKNGPRFYEGLVEETLAVVDRLGARARVMVSSFDQFALKRSEELAPEVPRALAWGMGRLLEPWTVASAASCAVVHPHWVMVPGEDVERMHEHGLKVALWGLSGPADVRAAVAHGGDAIFVDDPAWADRNSEGTLGDDH